MTVSEFTVSNDMVLFNVPVFILVLLDEEVLPARINGTASPISINGSTKVILLSFKTAAD